MNELSRWQQGLDRRRFLRGAGAGLGALALAARARAAGMAGTGPAPEGPIAPHFAPRAKRVIFLFMAGGPSQLDLFDPKPKLVEMTGQPMPESLTRGQRVAQLRGRELIIVGSKYRFRKHGQCGADVSELLPHTAEVVDELAIVKTMQTDAINHDPGMTEMQTGFQQPGRPSMGSWVSYALGPESDVLPPFTVLISGAASGAQPLYSRLWGAAFLPGHHQGVRMRSGEQPVLFLEDPPGVQRESRRRWLAALKKLQGMELERTGDAQVATRRRAYDMAFAMQESMPELADVSSEPEHVLKMYGVEPGVPSFAMNCLLARRMAERGVRFVQLYHRGWDHHEWLPPRIEAKCRETDRPSAALVRDLEQRGLLDDTLVIWGGEFGRTPMNQGAMSDGNYGRDHHGKAFTMWLAGGGIKKGVVHGTTDDFGYDVVEGGVHVHDLHATVLRCLGFDHERLTYRSSGRDFRLTDVAGKIVPGLLA